MTKNTDKNHQAHKIKTPQVHTGVRKQVTFIDQKDPLTFHKCHNTSCLN